MPGLPGMGGKRSKQRQGPSQGRKKRGSGNPAKRAAQERAAAAPGTTPQDGAAAFGFGKEQQPPGQLPEDFELPKELRDLL
jgi:signal recognition particle subunit SRP54